ncbi:MAG: hypothetical protein V4537_01250 [Pseudomonadota bacterium]
MTRWPYAAWATAGFDAWMLGWQSAAVMGLRTAKIASGGDPDGTETRLMFAEKIETLVELQTKLMTGGMGTTPLSGSQATLKVYRRKVAANRRRLG